MAASARIQEARRVDQGGRRSRGNRWAGRVSRGRGPGEVGAVGAAARLWWLAVALSGLVEDSCLGIGDWTGDWEGLTGGSQRGVVGSPKLGDVAL